MKISTKNTIDASFSMASMTDIIFLLLLFLLITTSYSPKALPIDLPLSTHERTEPVQVNVTVTVTAQPAYYVEGKRVAFNQLQNVLKDVLAKTSSKVVLLRMDKGLSIAHMVKVADIANQLGAAVAIATEFGKKR